MGKNPTRLGSNQRPRDLQSHALPTKLLPVSKCLGFISHYFPLYFVIGLDFTLSVLGVLCI